MTMTFLLVAIFILSSLYAVALNTSIGRSFADKYAWLAFSLGELIIIGGVAVLGTVDAVTLFLLNASGALPMVLRAVWLDIADTRRIGLRKIYESSQTLAGRGGTEAD